VTTGFLRAFALNLASWVVELLGLVVVWFALPYRSIQSAIQPFSQFPQHGSWFLVRLPSWALWWDNVFDGMLGDKRGWWANECKGEHTTRFNMWRWAAVRNPGNYFSRNVCGVDVSGLSITCLTKRGVVEAAPYRGFMVLKGVDAKGKVYPRLYAEFAITKTHGLMLDFGWKIKLKHNGTLPDAPESERIKGIVLTLSPWKELT